tara:strand:- start:276 stop:842 length:567 start_codon:yes stop_codon:yes gene_type:complete
MPHIWELLILIVFICTLISSIKLLLEGIVSFPDNPVINFISSTWWCVCFLFILASTVGEFGRNELSPLPWVAFENAYAKHGIFEGILNLIRVVTAELWLFLIPSLMYRMHVLESKSTSYWGANEKDNPNYNEIKKVVDFTQSGDKDTSDRDKIFLARIINLLAGLLLISPHNSAYSLLGYFYFKIFVE